MVIVSALILNPRARQRRRRASMAEVTSRDESADRNGAEIEGVTVSSPTDRGLSVGKNKEEFEMDALKKGATSMASEIRHADV